MIASTSYRQSSWVAAHTLPIALALVWATAALLRSIETPALRAEIAAVVLAAPLTLWAMSRRHITARQASLLVVASLPILHMFGVSLTSDDPTAALLGSPPHWDGWLLWAGALFWFIAVIVGSERHDLPNVARVLALAGGVCSLWALAEVAGILTPIDPLVGGGMALFDNPSSLGQGLLVTLAATASLAVRRRLTARIRLAYALLAVVHIVTLFAIGARGALLGALMGVAAFAFTETGKTPMRRAVFLAGCTGVAAFMIGLAVGIAAWSGLFGVDAYARADALLTNRFVIWTDVAQAVSGNELAGTGMSQFEAIVDWEARPDGTIAEWFTYSEHNLVLVWLLGTGILGLSLYGLAAALVTARFVRIGRSPATARPIRILIAGCVATFVAMLTTWPDPLTLLSVSVVAACLLAGSELAPTPEGWAFPRRSHLLLAVPTAAILALTAFALFSAEPEITAQYRIAGARTSHPASRPGLTAEFRRAFAETGNPFYIEETLLYAVIDRGYAISDADAIEFVSALAADYPARAEGRIDIPALALEVLWMNRNTMDPAQYWRLSQYFVDLGSEADPEMPIWSYTLARAAYGAQRPEARTLISRALETSQPASAEALLRQWQASTR